MYLVDNYSLAVFFTVITMICWGSWPNLQKLVPRYRFEMFYLDYALGILMFSVFMAFTFGSYGDSGRGFIADMSQAQPEFLFWATFGGFIWSTGTILITAGIAIAGMAVAFPIGGGIGWIFGILTSYIVRPESNPAYLFTGALFILAAIILSMLSYKRLATSKEKPPAKGIIISVLAGVCIAFFYSFVARSLDPDYLPANAGKLTPYSAAVMFGIGSLVSALIFIPILMAKPLQGPKIRFMNYFKATKRQHGMGILAGLIFGLGNSLSFMAANSASPAISYALSNAAVVVAAIWGVFVWKEFKGAPKGTNIMLAFMFVSYLVGLVLVVIARF